MSRRGAGQGTFRKLKTGRIEHRMSFGFDAHGRRMQISVYGKTNRECAVAMAKKLEEVRRLGAVRVVDNRTFGSWLTEWLDGKRDAVAADELAPATYRQYEAAVRLHIKPHLGAIRLDRLSVRDGDLWLRKLSEAGVGGRARQYARMVAVAALKDAERAELVDRNVLAKVKAPKHRTAEFEVWDVDEVRAFLAAASSDRFAAFWTLWLTTGARPHELLGLRPADVDLGAGTISITQQLARGGQKRSRTKTPTARRTVDLTPMAIEALRLHNARRLAEGVRASDWLFSSKTGTAMNYRNLIADHFERIVRAAGVKRIRPYDLRHTYVSLALKAGVGALEVSKSVGHAKVGFTLSTYAHVLPSMREDHVAKIEALLSPEAATVAAARAR